MRRERRIALILLLSFCALSAAAKIGADYAASRLHNTNSIDTMADAPR
jgi:hypothetical protein